jgi:hypothetical protein
MNKKVNTLIFILCGTIVNLLIAIIFIGILLFAIGQFNSVLGPYMTTAVPVAFFAGLIAAMFVYQKLTKWVIMKFNLEDKLDPIIKMKSKKR